jgi:hypothetical protein
MAQPLTWRYPEREVDAFVGYDGDWDVAMVQFVPSTQDWHWSIYMVFPPLRNVTFGYEKDPKEARRKVEMNWAYAISNGIPFPNPTAVHYHVDRWLTDAEQQTVRNVEPDVSCVAQPESPLPKTLRW